MHIFLAKKQLIPAFILAISTLLFSSLSFSYQPGLEFDTSRDDTSTTNIDESLQGCVYRQSDVNGGSWRIDDCDYIGAHYACYNGSEWRVAQALGTANNPGEPIDGDSASKTKSMNSWDPIKADSQCKNNFGPSYFFSVPVSADEDAKLGKSIGDISAAKKRTWIYYYSNANNFDVSNASTENYWLGNRSQYTNLFIGNLSSFGGVGSTSSLPGVKDCVVMHRNTTEGLWQQASCAEKRSFACYVMGDWKITAEQGMWRAGFAVCEKEYGQHALYAVPRDSGENILIKASALPASGTGIAADYNKVWLNQTDLAFEEFFISNQTRQAWWGEGQPTNRNNSDCTLVDSQGNWISETCNGVVAKHACYLGENASASAQWVLTDKKAESALGFGYCKQKNGNSEYRPPNSKFSNDGLATHIAEGEYVWVNYSDQVSEGYWKVSTPFQDFVTITNVIDGDAQDCGYFSLNTDNKRNWLAGQCYAGGAPLQQGFACSNGYEWKIATEANGTSLESDLWKDGFDACKSAFGQDYEFAAPFDAHENSKLALALQLSGKTQAWLNINDAKTEGEWVSNGPVVNLSPVITALTSELEFPEKTEIQLSVTAKDPEEANSVGLVYEWKIIDQYSGVNGNGTDIVTPLDNTDLAFSPSGTPNTVVISKSKLNLLNYDYYIDLQLSITDADVSAPATTVKVVTVKVKSPLRAAYDFNQYTNPGLDISGNGHNLILNVSQVEITPHENISDDYFAKLDATDSFSIEGGQFENGELVRGLQLDPAKSQYTVIYRFRVDDVVGTGWAGFMQKGASPGIRQPGIFFNKDTRQIQAANSTSIEANANVMSNETVRVGQWMTVAYVKDIKDATGFAAGQYVRLYIDKAEGSISDPLALQSAPDSGFLMDAAGVPLGYDSGDWTFGNVLGSAEGIIGGFDDIRIYDRALSKSELVSIFKDQPRGEFQFANQQEVADEHETQNSVNLLSIPVSRVKGDDGIVDVGFKLISGTATINTDFRLQGDLSTGTDPVEGTLTWGVHDADDKNIVVELIGDTLREGTETFSIELVEIATQPPLGTNTKIDVNIIDQTPNPYGAIGFAPTTAIENISVQEGNSGSITIERIGTDSVGNFDVLYEIKSATAHMPDDFSITGDSSASYVASGNTGVGVVIGSGRLKFIEALGQTRQTQTINFSTVGGDLSEFDEYFTVELSGVTDPDVLTLANPNTSAILGSSRFYTQIIKDKTTGRINFVTPTYTADEVDQGSGSNVVTVQLERLGGTDGAVCLTLDTSTSSAGVDDYLIEYLNPSVSGQQDIFWADGTAGTKSVRVTINEDNLYDPNENVQLSWVAKASCNGVSTVFPDSSEITDNTMSTVFITDHTAAVALRFTEASYTVSELTPVKTITIQASQTGFVSLENKNAFKVFLNRGAGSAIEGEHYGDLTNQQVVSFAAGETEKTINIPIVDNCDAAASLSFGFGLSKTDPSLSNTLPNNLIDVSSTSSTLIINDAAPPFSVLTAVNNDGVSNASELIAGRYRVTNAGGNNNNGFDLRDIGLVASNTGDDCALSYQWEYVNANPTLPISTFGSIAPSSNLGSGESVQFTLPFVAENTSLNYKLTVIHPELGMTELNKSLEVAPYWMRFRHNQSNQQMYVRSGNDLRLTNGNSSETSRNFIYSKVTQQIIGQKKLSGQYGCWDGLNYNVCNTEAANQKLTYSTGASGGTCSSETQIYNQSKSDSYYRVVSTLYFAGSPGWASCARRDWDWIGTP